MPVADTPCVVIKFAATGWRQRCMYGIVGGQFDLIREQLIYYVHALALADYINLLIIVGPSCVLDMA